MVEILTYGSLGTLWKLPPLPELLEPGSPEAAAVRVIALGQELPQGPVDDDQGDGELARLLGVSLPPLEWGLHLGAGLRACRPGGGPATGRPYRGALCNVSTA